MEWRLYLVVAAAQRDQTLENCIGGRLLGYLPAEAVGCNIGDAYQAADVSHPNGAERARRRARTFSRNQYLVGQPRRRVP